MSQKNNGATQHDFGSQTKIFELERPLITDQKEGGAREGRQSFQRMVNQKSHHKPNDFEGVPKQIVIKSDYFDPLKEIGGHIPEKQLIYDINRQAYFDIQASRLDNLQSIRSPEKLQRELEDKIQNQDLQSNIKLNQQIFKRKNLNNEPFQEFLSDGFKNEQSCPQEDLSKGEKFIKRCVEEFVKQLQQFKILSFDNQSASVLKNVKEFKQQIVKDQKDLFDQNLVNINLISSGNLKNQHQLYQVRKEFVPTSQSEPYHGSLKLSLKRFSSNSDQFEDYLNDQKLISLDGKEAWSVFGGNFDCLFNHLQFRNTLYFFKVAKSAGENPKFTLKLKCLTINDEYASQSLQDEFQIEITQESIDEDVPHGKVIGVSIIPNLQQKQSQVINSNQPSFYFYIIKVNIESEPQLCFDIRHSLNPQQSILKQSFGNQNQQNVENVFYNRQPFLAQVSVQKIFYQMALTKKFTYESLNQMNKNLTRYLEKRYKDQLDSDLQRQFHLRMTPQVPQSNAQEGKQPKFYTLNDLSILVIGNTNPYIFEKVHDFFFVHPDNEGHCMIGKNYIMKQEEIDSMKSMLAECLKLVTLQCTCSVLKYDSMNQRAEISRKYQCRGQKEFVKRVLTDAFDKPRVTQYRRPTFNLDNSENLMTANDLDATQFGYAKAKNAQQASQNSSNLSEVFSNYGCSTLIDTITRHMTILLYHLKQPQKQFMLSFKLKHLAQVCDVSTYSQDNSVYDRIVKQSYNQLFFKIISSPQDWTQVMRSYRKFIITKRFENIVRYERNIFGLENDTLHKIIHDQQDPILALKSRFQILMQNEDADVSLMKNQSNKHQFIYAMINLQYDTTMSDDPVGSNIEEFTNYTDNKLRHQFLNESNQNDEQQSNFTENFDMDEQAYSKQGIDAESYRKSICFSDSYVILQNVITVEDDREDIPMVFIDKNCRGIQFAIVQFDKIRAITSLYVNTIDTRELRDSMLQPSELSGNQQQLVQFCASSDILEGIDVKNKVYLYQNYTIAVYYQNQMRFSMYEYQVQWRPNEEKKKMNTQPLTVSIHLVKLRELILSQNNETLNIDDFMLMPLYEAYRSVISDPNSKSECLQNHITGVQLILSRTDSNAFYIDLRSLIDDQVYSVENQEEEFNFKQKLTISKTKFIQQHHFEALYVETQFRNQRQGDLSSDCVNTELLDDWQSYEILSEANNNAMNSMPLNFVSLMDLPEIIDEYFQSETTTLSMNLQQQNSIKLRLNDLFHQNFKRYFSNCEINEGFQLFENYGQTQQQEDGEEPIVMRDPYKLKQLLEHLNLQHQDRFWDFKFLKDLRTPKFALTPIESILRDDQQISRYFFLLSAELILDGRNIIRANKNNESLIEQSLLINDQHCVNAIAQQVNAFDHFSKNSFSQMMRVLPILLDSQMDISEQFHWFFGEQNNSNFDRVEDNSVDQQAFEKLFRVNDITKSKQVKQKLNQKNKIRLCQPLSQIMQLSIGLYSNSKLSVFVEKSLRNVKNLIYSNSEMQAFRLFKDNESMIKGSNFEVQASYVDFKHFILGKKLQTINKAKNLKQLLRVKKNQINSYDLSIIMQTLLRKTNKQIIESKIVRDIIDWQYQTTQTFFLNIIIFYIVFYCVPFITQMYLQDATWIVICNCICMFSHLLSLYYQYITCKQQGCNLYMSSFVNIIGLFNTCFYTIYFYNRVTHKDLDLIPRMQIGLKPSAKEAFVQQESQKWFKLWCPFFHNFLILFGFFRLLYLFRFNKHFGQLVQLVQTCINDQILFNIFFVSWVIMFSFLFYTNGVNFDEKDYPMVPKLQYLLQTFRNVIGDVSPPSYDYWQELQQLQGKDRSMFSTPMLAIYQIWVLWFFNQYFNMIILLSFLIAIIGQSYSDVIQNSLMFEYDHKQELNVEIMRFKNHFKNLKTFDMICLLSSQSDEVSANHESQDSLSQIKQTLADHQQIMAKQRDEIGKLKALNEERFDKLNQDLNQKIDTVQLQISNQFEKFARNLQNQLKQIHGQIQQNQGYRLGLPNQPIQSSLANNNFR